MFTSLTSILASLIITILPPGASTLGGECGKEIAGVYYVETKEIFVCELADGNTEYYRQHEIGHYVWYEILTTKQRIEYTKMYDIAKKKGLRAFDNSYAYTNEEEDFAENYSLLTMQLPIGNRYIKARIKKIQYYLRINK